MDNKNLVKYIETAWLLESECYELGEKIQIQENFLNGLKAKETANNKQICNVRQSYVAKPQMSEWYDGTKSAISEEKKDKTKYCILMVLSIPLIEFAGIGLILLVHFYKKYKECKKSISRISKNLSDMQADYSRDMERYNKELSTLDQRKSSAISKLEEENKKIAYMISETTNTNYELYAILNEKRKNLNEYYEGIVHKKYQDINSISYFYDYLDTGRCETLKECMNKLDDDLFHEKVYKKFGDLSRAISYGNVQMVQLGTKIDQLNKNITAAASAITGILSDMSLENYEYYQNSNNTQMKILKETKYTNDLRERKAILSGEILPMRW